MNGVIDLTKEPNVRDAMLLKLKGSTLTEADAKKLRMEPMTAKDLKIKRPELNVGKAGFTIPYFDIKGRPTSFYRYRFLEDSRDGFSRKTKTKAQKYGQVADTVNEAYFPPLLDWTKVVKDASVAVVVTEGELKSACACKHGLPTIGIGGVWCWKSGRKGISFLPQLEDFEWNGRKVYICFDSDIVTNDKVLDAERALADELTQRGANVLLCRIPTEGDDKVGLDDFVLAKGIKGFFGQVLAKAEPYGLSDKLFDYNTRFIYLTSTDQVYGAGETKEIVGFSDDAYTVSKEPSVMSTKHFFSRMGNDFVMIQQGNQVLKKSAPKMWMEWPLRRQARDILYAPGQPEHVGGCANIWEPSTVVPKKGDMKPWHEFMDRVFAGSPKEHRQWFERWCAYPLQNPGVKLLTAVVLFSTEHGSGKSRLGSMIGKLYGHNYTRIRARDLRSQFNNWVMGSQFVLADEVSSNSENKHNSADALKELISEEELRVEAKYQSSRMARNYANFLFTTNHVNAFALEGTDRRFFVHEMKTGLLDPKFAVRLFDDWYARGGKESLLYYLLHLDMGDFNPMAPAPLTSTKDLMRDAASSDVMLWAKTLKETEGASLCAGNTITVNWDLATTAEILAFFNTDDRKNHINHGTMMSALVSVGMKMAGGGKKVPTCGSTPDDKPALREVWILRNVEKYAAMNLPDIGREYDRQHGNAVRRKPGRPGREPKF